METQAVIVGIGGFVSVPVILATKRFNNPISLINVDIVPGKANKLLKRLSSHVFLQFDETTKYFKNVKNVTVTGCPLRESFNNPNMLNTIEFLELDPGKHTLLVTGASSGSVSINNALIKILPQLDQFAQSWQVVHLTGLPNYNRIIHQIKDLNFSISYQALDYYENMAELYAASDIVVGRSGAVSVAEYAASGLCSICLPYPYHKDKHQYLNAQTLTNAGAAVIIDDNAPQTPGQLLKSLTELMQNDYRRNQMSHAALSIAKPEAAKNIAQTLLNISN